MKSVVGSPTTVVGLPDNVSTYAFACTAKDTGVGSVPIAGLAAVEMVPNPAAVGLNVKVLAEDVPAHVKLVGENVPVSAVDGVIVPV